MEQTTVIRRFLVLEVIGFALASLVHFGVFVSGYEHWYAGNRALVVCPAELVSDQAGPDCAALCQRFNYWPNVRSEVEGPYGKRAASVGKQRSRGGSSEKSRAAFLFHSACPVRYDSFAKRVQV